MVERILEQESAIRVVLSADRKVSHLIPTWQDIEVLQSIHKALSPLLSLTDILSGENYVTVSAVLPMLQLIEISVLKEDENDTQLTKDMKRRIITDLTRRYPASSDVSEIQRCATFLDPRFKSKPFSDSEMESIKEMIVFESIVIQSVATPSSEQSSDGGSLEPPPAKRKKNLGTFFKKHEEDQQVSNSTNTTPITTEQQCRKELTDYLSIEKLDFEEDPLMWWKLASSKLLILSNTACKYLCVCATSLSSERVFSCSSNIVTPT